VRAGDLPMVDPVGQIDDAVDRADALLDVVARHIGVPLGAAERLIIDIPTGDDRWIQGSVPMVLGNIVSLVTPSRSNTTRVLTAWTYLALAAAQTEGRINRAIVIQRGAKSEVDVTEIHLEPEQINWALKFVISSHDSAVSGPVIRFPETSAALALGDLRAARAAWGSDGSYGSGGATEHEGVAAQLLLALDFDDLLATTDIESEARQFWTALHDLSSISTLVESDSDTGDGHG
jgi:hypothetical protein